MFLLLFLFASHGVRGNNVWLSLTFVTLQIVIHASGMVGAILEEELGSGYFDLQATSGSGWMESNGDSSDTTYVDDEDFASHKVEIDVECRVPRSDAAGSNQVGQGPDAHFPPLHLHMIFPLYELGTAAVTLQITLPLLLRTARPSVYEKMGMGSGMRTVGLEWAAHKGETGT